MMHLTTQELLVVGSAGALLLGGWNAWLEYRFRSGERANAENKKAIEHTEKARARLHVRLDEMREAITKERIDFNKQVSETEYNTLRDFVSKSDFNNVMKKLDDALDYLRNAVDQINKRLSENKP